MGHYNNSRSGVGVLYWTGRTWKDGAGDPYTAPEGSTARAFFRAGYENVETKINGVRQFVRQFWVKVRVEALSGAAWVDVFEVETRDDIAAGKGGAGREWYRNLESRRGHTATCRAVLGRLPGLKSGADLRPEALELAAWVNKPLALAELNPVEGETLVKPPTKRT